MPLNGWSGAGQLVSKLSAGVTWRSFADRHRDREQPPGRRPRRRSPSCSRHQDTGGPGRARYRELQRQRQRQIACDQRRRRAPLRPRIARLVWRRAGRRRRKRRDKRRALRHVRCRTDRMPCPWLQTSAWQCRAGQRPKSTRLKIAKHEKDPLDTGRSSSTPTGWRPNCPSAASRISAMGAKWAARASRSSRTRSCAHGAAPHTRLKTMPRKGSRP